MEKKIVLYNDKAFKVDLSDNCTTIHDSYLIKRRKDMRIFLDMLREDSDDNFAINKRSISGMVREWTSHNLLYTLNLWRNRTMSVDLQIEQKWYVKLGYFLLNLIYI